MKDAYYFTHDSNSRTDVRMVALRRQHGWAGYGLWWALIECMREEPEYHLQRDRIADLAYEWRADDLQAVVDTCCELGLFECVDGYMVAPSLVRRMGAWEAKREKAREAGRIGGLTSVSSKRSSERLANAQAKRREEKRLEEKRLEENTMVIPPYQVGFDELWDKYPRKVGKRPAYKAYVARRRADVSADDLLHAVEHYAMEVKGKEAEYVKHCATFLGPNEHWKEALSRWQPPGLTSEEKRSKANAAIARAIAKKQASQLGEPSSAGG